MADGSTFRIVHIFPGFYDDRIECEFLEVPTSAEPNYSALSYTWGKPDITTFVRCRGCNIGIGENLENALRRIRSPVYIRGFWIDALCIDQRDDAREKTTQIPLMRRIYQQSSKVIIYLGEEQDGSDKIPSLCESVTRAYDTVLSPCEPINAQVKGYAYWESLPRININSESYEEFGFPSSNSKDWEIFPRFLSRPWFARVWVIQEAILSTSAEIICGLWAMEWRKLVQAILKSKLIGISIVPDDVLRGGMRVSDYETPMRSLTQILFMENLGASQPSFVRWRCIDLLYLGRLALTTRPHDYCYGLLGIAEELDHPDLKVDYTLPVEEVYRQFARFFVRSGDGVKVLYNASGHQLELPSWVPDWSYRFTRQTRAAPGAKGERDEDSPSAAASYPSSIRLHPSLPDVLVVRGIMVDYIETIGLCHLSTLTTNGSRDQPLSANELDATNPINKADLRLVADCVVEISHLVRDEPSPAYPVTEHEESIIWKTLTCGYPDRSMRKKRLSLVDFYRQFLLLIMSLVPGWLVPHLLDTDLRALILRSNAKDMTQNGGLFLSTAYQHCYDKRRGRTARGYIGQFSHLAQVGDFVFLPLGSAEPFSIRPKSDGTYELIGECYVHGIMKGEAFGLRGVAEKDIHLS